MRIAKTIPVLLSCLCLGTAVADETPEDEGASPAAAPEAAQEVTVSLSLGAPDGKIVVPYGESKAIPLEPTAPRFLFEVPKFKAKDPLYFRIDLGETGGVAFFGALDRSGKSDHHDLLHLDRNRDLDLTNDGAPIEARLRDVRDIEKTLVEFLDLELQLPYRAGEKEIREPYRTVFFYYATKENPLVIQVERDGWREGKIFVDGQAHVVAVLDDDNNGIFTEADSWQILPLDKRDTLLARDRTRRILYPCWAKGQGWMVEVESIEASGRSLEVKVFKAKETEREFFVRIARRRQSEEERSLDINPLRPKAKRGEKIDWLVKEDVRRALEIGRKVKKPVLIDFWSKGCVWCTRMEKYSYRDREVVQLAKRFVCIKQEHKDGAASAHKYGVGGTPTYVILDTDGTELARHEGFLKPSSFAKFLKRNLR